MLRDYRRCRNGQKLDIHGRYRAINKNHMYHERYDDLAVRESMTSHQKMAYLVWDDGLRRTNRDFSYNAIDKIIDKFIGKPYNELMGYVRRRLSGDRLRCTVEYIEREFNILPGRWHLRIDRYVDKNGICIDNKKPSRQKPKAALLVVPNGKSSCFINTNNGWQYCRLVSSDHFKHIKYYDDHSYVEYGNDAFGFNAYGRSWLAGWAHTNKNPQYYDSYPQYKRKAKSSEIKFIESYIETNKIHDVGYIEV